MNNKHVLIKGHSEECLGEEKEFHEYGDAIPYQLAVIESGLPPSNWEAISDKIKFRFKEGKKLMTRAQFHDGMKMILDRRIIRAKMAETC